MCASTNFLKIIIFFFHTHLERKHHLAKTITFYASNQKKKSITLPISLPGLVIWAPPPRFIFSCIFFSHFIFALYTSKCVYSYFFIRHTQYRSGILGKNSKNDAIVLVNKTLNWKTEREWRKKLLYDVNEKFSDLVSFFFFFRYVMFEKRKFDKTEATDVMENEMKL